MILIAIFLLVLFVFAIAFAWLADNPGTVNVQWPWLGESFEVSLLVAIIGLSATVAAVMALWWVIGGIIKSPQTFGRWRAGRRRDKGYKALSKGLVAAGAGNAPLARKLSRESAKMLEHEPLVTMLDAQTALLEGRREDARHKFEAMLENDETRLLGLRGLYVEAEKEGATEASAHFAKQANDHAPGTPWAAQAALKALAQGGDWRDALNTLDNNRAGGLYEKDEYRRKRAVILTALALEEEDGDPQNARAHALAAHKLAPSLVPAAVCAARLSAREGNIRKAVKVLETSWKKQPHPEIANTYVTLKTGDTAVDRLKRAEKLASKNPQTLEGNIAIARAAIDAAEWAKARNAMEPVLASQTSESACLLMADIEEGEHGDRGRVREWLARAVNAPRDAAWTADGIVSKDWAPFSPISGELDSFEWKVPVEQIDAAPAVDYSKFVNLPLPEPDPEPIAVEEPAELETVEPASTPSAASAVAAGLAAAAKATPPADVESNPVAEKTADTQTNDNAPATPIMGMLADTGIGSSPNKPDDPLHQAADDIENDSREATTVASPFKTTDLDEDKDGVIDHRPDDPGVFQRQAEKRKGIFF